MYGIDPARVVEYSLRDCRFAAVDVCLLVSELSKNPTSKAYGDADISQLVQSGRLDRIEIRHDGLLCKRLRLFKGLLET